MSIEAALDTLFEATHAMRVTIYKLELAHRKRCTNCRNFDKQAELCSIAKQRPPAHVIASGCPSFDDEDEIPF